MRHLLAVLLVTLALAMPEAEASFSLRATVEEVRSGDSFTLVASYAGPDPAVLLLRVPRELEIVEPLRATSGNCGIEGIWPEPEKQVILCEAFLSEERPLTVAIEVRALPQTCGPGSVLVVEGESTGGGQMNAPVLLKPAACPAPTPTAPPAPTWRAWLPYVRHEA